jgi:hypothetical protein
MEKGAVRVNAAKVLGTVQEVAAFRELKEVRNISSSEDARAKIMQELRTLMLNSGEAVDVEAKALLDELQSPVGSQETRDYIDDDSTEVLDEDGFGVESGETEPHDDPTTPRPSLG